MIESAPLSAGRVEHTLELLHTRVIKDVFYAGVSVSNLSDNFLIFHVTFDDIKQKVEL